MLTEYYLRVRLFWNIAFLTNSFWYLTRLNFRASVLLIKNFKYMLFVVKNVSCKADMNDILQLEVFSN